MGDPVKELLAERGWTQEELAQKAKMTRTDINAVVNNRLELGRDRLQRIADAFEVSVLELGAPETDADRRGRSLIDRHEELEAEVVRLAKGMQRLTRRVGALERRLADGASASAPVRRR